MSESEKKLGKVEIKIGDLSFSAEGDQDWLAEQVTRVIDAAGSSFSAGAPAAAEQNSGAAKEASKSIPSSLASYIKAKGGESMQAQRFLATAGWLSLRGTKELTTAMVSSALSDNHQKRLSNPADCLNKNCSKGLCEKNKGGFFVTPEGWSALGESA